MTIRAENNPRFYRRFLIMGILAIGFAIYCLYDGLVGYPARRIKGFGEFKSDFKSLFTESKHENISLDEFETVANRDDRLTWDRYAHDRGIPSRPDVITQFVMATITTVAAVVLISIPLRSRNRWIELDDSGLHSSWGQSVPIDQIEVLNKRKWRDKGIAKITYRDGIRKLLFVLDDFKFMRDPTDSILFELEHRIGIERITGGPPEQLEVDHADHDAHAATPNSADDASSND